MKTSIWDCLKGASLIRKRTAMITGAATGIGKACAQLFASQGADLILVDNRKNELNNIFSEIKEDSGVNVFSICADLTRVQDIKKIFLEIDENNLSFQILVNNAGGGLPTEYSKISLEEWNTVLFLNLTSVFLLSQEAALRLKKQGKGAIVNLSSIAGRSTSITAGCYYTSAKTGLLGLTRHMARQLAPLNIRVNAVCPGVINSKRILDRIEDRRKSIEDSIPLGRIGDVDEVAACCLFLASDLSGYITGASLDVNGGALMI